MFVCMCVYVKAKEKRRETRPGITDSLKTEWSYSHNKAANRGIDLIVDRFYILCKSINITARFFNYYYNNGHVIIS